MQTSRKIYIYILQTKWKISQKGFKWTKAMLKRHKIVEEGARQGYETLAWKRHVKQQGWIKIQGKCEKVKKRQSKMKIKGEQK